MSTVTEIEDAIARLPEAERENLETRILARRFGMDPFEESDRAELLESFDEAEREMEAGHSHTIEELRAAVRTWAGR